MNTLNNKVKEIFHEGILHAIIISQDWQPAKTEFLTSPELNMQLGSICYRKDDSITPHRHLDYERKINGTSECLIVQKGECFMDLYDSSNSLFDTHILKKGMIVLLYGGAHGFRMIEDTTFIEIKQGPFVLEQDKKRFNA